MEEKDAVALREDSLLTKAIEKGFDTQTIKDLIELRNKEIERQAKVDFDIHFAAMQSEFTPVGKSSKATDANGKTLYAYCPIEVILAMAAPIIAKHGFSYRWTEEALANKEKRINCIISGYGHSETGFVDIPFMEPSTRATNAIQMRGSATTYGKRYSFLNATGIIVGGEDNDALSNSTPGAVKVEIIPDEAGEAPPASPPPTDPIEALIADIKAEVLEFAKMAGSEDGGKAYFTDDEKTFYKAKIAAINEGIKNAKDRKEGCEIKLRDMKALNVSVKEELEKRKGNTPLAQAMKDALKGKADEQPELGAIPGAGRETF